jgi:hypothetical protein
MSDYDISAAPIVSTLVDYSTTSAPTSLTDLCSGKDCWVGFFVASNPTASPITLLAQSGEGTPFQLVPTVSIPANTQIVENFQPTGIKLLSGFKIQAGSAGLHFSMHARRVT